MRGIAILIGAGGAFVAAISTSRAQLPDGPPPLPASAYRVPWQQVNMEDRRFIGEALLAGYFAMDIGRLAAQNGSMPAVRRAAAELVRENQAAVTALAALARRKGVKAPRGLDPAHIAPLDRMAALRGAAFDRVYLAAVAESRDSGMRACDAEIANGGDPDLREFARRRRALLAGGQRTARAARPPAAPGRR